MVTDTPAAMRDDALVERLYPAALKRLAEYAAEIAALRAENDALKARLTECADDLETEVRDRWGYDERLAHKLERDLAPVVAARALLGSKP